MTSDLDAVVRLARAATAHNTGETVWEASTHGDRHVLRMSSWPRAQEAITGLAVAGWDARLMPEDGGHPRIEVRRAP